MDIKKIKAIVELVTSSKIAELEISEGEDKLRITTATPYDQSLLSNSPNVLQQPPLQITPSSNNIQQIQVTTPSIQDNIEEIYTEDNYITSPMVGTFYRSSSPTSTPFVEIGKEVEAGQILCIIEAMKLMNQIESDKSGVIKEILVKDGSPVEYGQKLFMIS